MYILILLLIHVLQPCTLQQQSIFLNKVITNPVHHYTSSPYLNTSAQYIRQVQQYSHDNSSFCILRYNDSQRKAYSLYTSAHYSNDTLEFITHKGKCGECSTLQDLYVYLSENLTKPVRACGLLSAISNKLTFNCILKLGFSYSCAQIWYYNTLATKKSCGRICIKSLIERQPFIIDGNLNKCLQCDEIKSGPIFKFESGRTRRNSGIHSQIERPKDQIYKMTHCYY